MEDSAPVEELGLSAEQLSYVKGLIDSNPDWSRWRLSRRIAEAWQWRGPSGALRDMAARNLLNKLDARGLIVLPAPRRAPSRPRRRLGRDAHRYDGPLIETALEQLRPVSLSLVESPQEIELTRALFASYHYLGEGGPAGAKVAYLARDSRQRLLACVLFCSAAWKVGCRDEHIGWSAHYKLFSRSKWDPGDLFKPVIEGAVPRYCRSFIAVAFDDTVLKRTGKKLSVARWLRDAMGPPFRVNLIWGVRFLQASLLVPLYRQDKSAPPRALPVRFEQSAPVKKPDARATDEEKQAWKETQKKKNLSTHFFITGNAPTCFATTSPSRPGNSCKATSTAGKSKSTTATKKTSSAWDNPKSGPKKAIRANPPSPWPLTACYCWPA